MGKNSILSELFLLRASYDTFYGIISKSRSVYTAWLRHSLAATSAREKELLLKTLKFPEKNSN